MAKPTVSPQITDAVTQTNTKVIADAPAMAGGNLMMAMSQGLSNAAHNAAEQQQHGAILQQAATSQAAMRILRTDRMDTASLGQTGGGELKTTKGKK